MRYMPRRDEFDEEDQKDNPGGTWTVNQPPLSMHEALAKYENNKEGFDVADLKQLSGVCWDQSVWDDLAKSSFDIALEDQSPRLPYFDSSAGKWFYFP